MNLRELSGSLKIMRIVRRFHENMYRGGTLYEIHDISIIKIITLGMYPNRSDHFTISENYSIEKFTKFYRASLSISAHESECFSTNSYKMVTYFASIRSTLKYFVNYLLTQITLFRCANHQKVITV